MGFQRPWRYLLECRSLPYVVKTREFCEWVPKLVNLLWWYWFVVLYENPVEGCCSFTGTCALACETDEKALVRKGCTSAKKQPNVMKIASSKDSTETSVRKIGFLDTVCVFACCGLKVFVDNSSEVAAPVGDKK